MAEALPTPAEATYNDLRQFVVDVCAAEAGIGIDVDAADDYGKVKWPNRTADQPYDDIKVGFDAFYSGRDTRDMRIGWVTFVADDREASMTLDPYELPRITRDPFAEGFLARLRHEFVMHRHDLCLAALMKRQAARAETRMESSFARLLQEADLPVHPKKPYSPTDGILLSGDKTERMSVQAALQGRQAA